MDSWRFQVQRKVESLTRRQRTTSPTVPAETVRRPSSPATGLTSQVMTMNGGSVTPAEVQQVPTPVYKVVTVGGGGVGKSSLIIQFMYDEFLEDYEPTKVDSYRKRIQLDSGHVMLDILDTAGQDEYAAIRDQYLRTADGFLCVFSLAEPESLQDIVDIRDQIVRVSGGREDIPCVMVGNKADLDETRAVQAELAARWSDLWHVPYIETSAKTNLNVDMVFYELMRQIKKHKEELETAKLPSTAPTNNTKPSAANGVFIRQGSTLRRVSTNARMQAILAEHRATLAKSKRKRAAKKRQRELHRSFRRMLRRVIRQLVACTRV